jgi:dsDNA-specific endonuclease/ATPase MutS2
MSASPQVEQARTSDSDRPLGLFRQTVSDLAAGEARPEGHAIAVLEFARVLDVVAGYAASSAGAARVRELAPSTNRPAIIGEHARVEAMRALVTSEGGWTPEAIPDLSAPLERLKVPGTSWTGQELREAVTLLSSSRTIPSSLTTLSISRSVA